MDNFGLIRDVRSKFIVISACGISISHLVARKLGWVEHNPVMKCDLKLCIA